MMQTVEIHPWTLLVDSEATRSAYARVPSGDADTCQCLNCRNYVAVRPGLFPAAAQRVFDQLGVDAGKEASVLDVGPLTGGRTRVIGTLHAIGQLASAEPPVGAPSVELGPGFRLSITEGEWHAPSAFHGQPLLLLSFEADVPWTLPEPHPEAAAVNPPAG